MSGIRYVLVTGGLGYIGSVLTDYLRKRDVSCKIYDTGFFKDCYLYPPSMEPGVVLQDVRQLQKEDLKGVDAVIHLAGISNAPLNNLQSEEIYEPTRLYALKIAQFCKELGIKFIFASSCSVYGKGRNDFLTEDSEAFPQTPYSLNKFQIEQGLRAISDGEFSPIILRFATVYGLSPRMRFDLVVNMLVGMAVVKRNIILNSDGQAWRPHVHIDDVCKAILYCLDTRFNPRGLLVLNVGDNADNFQILDIAHLVQKKLPECEISFLNKSNMEDSGRVDLIRDRTIQDGVDTRTYKVSFELIKKIFPNFQCGWPLEKGIESMIEVFNKLPLVEEIFNSIDFYRLQKLEHWFRNGYLTDDLCWKNRPTPYEK